MSRYTGSVCKLCRREREKLVLKGEKCFTKCTLDMKRGKNVPGMHGTSRSKPSEYSRRLREKQKARRIFGLNEAQFRNYYERAEKMKGMTGDNLLRLLELRLDNAVYRLGFTTSRKAARQIVNHGNVLVNGKKVDIPNYQVKAGDKITLREAMKENVFVKKSIEKAGQMPPTPSWLKLDKEHLTGSVVSVPLSEDFSSLISSQLIVELYSK